MGRHQQRRLSPTTWVAALAGLAVAGAIALTMAPANAAPGTVTATFGVTGISGSNCDTQTGGSDIWVAPGDDLKAKTSLAGISVAGINLGLADSLAGLNGTLTIDPKAKTPVVKRLKAATTITLPSLSTGDHKFTFQADALGTSLGLTLPFSISSDAAAAGGKATWNGTIHVTKDAAQCGVSAQAPGGEVSASVTNLPPVHATLPGANLPTAKVTLPNVGSKLPGLPNIPGLGGKSSKPGSGGTKSSTTKYTPPALTVPEQVMPRAVNFGGGGAGFAAPGNDGGTGGSGGYVAPGNNVTSTAAPEPTGTAAENVKAAKKTVDVAQKSQLGGAQLPVLLAIVAILALAAVTAMYAKMYLLGRNS
jgi:hypothetical protein